MIDIHGYENDGYSIVKEQLLVHDVVAHFFVNDVMALTT
jgi:hypothetical protein